MRWVWVPVSELMRTLAEAATAMPISSMRKVVTAAPDAAAVASDPA